MFSALLVTYHCLSKMKKRPITSDAIGNDYYSFVNVPLYIIRRLVRIWPSLIIGKIV